MLGIVRKLAPFAGGMVLLAFVAAYLPGGLTGVFLWIEEYFAPLLGVCFLVAFVWWWRKKGARHKSGD